MAIEENKVFIRHQVEEVWNRSNPHVIALYWEEELEAEMERSHTILNTAFPDIKVRVEDLIADDDKVAAPLLFEGTHRGPFMGI